MESHHIVKTPSSSIAFPVTAKGSSSFTNLFGILKERKLWNDKKKHYTVSLRLQRPHQLFTTKFVTKNNNDNIVWTNAARENFSHQGESSTIVPKSPWESFQRNFDIFFRFARVTVIFQTVLSVISMSLLTVENLSDISPSFLTSMLLVIVAALGMNIYTSGLNHLCDIEIDKVNKPEHPVASGEYSMKSGALVVVLAAVTGLSIPMILGSLPLLRGLFIGSFLLGFAYSVDLPLMRWKRSPLMTAIYFVVDTGVSQLAYYLHMQTHVLGRPAVLSKSLIFTEVITVMILVVFGIFKDIPDVAGDKLDGIKSLAILLGEKKVFVICISLLQITYLAAMLAGATLLSNPWSKFLTFTGHAAMALILWNRARSFDHSGPAAYKSFYIFLWELLSAEYLLVQFFR